MVNVQCLMVHVVYLVCFVCLVDVHRSCAFVLNNQTDKTNQKDQTDTSHISRTTKTTWRAGVSIISMRCNPLFCASTDGYGNSYGAKLPRL